MKLADAMRLHAVLLGLLEDRTPRGFAFGYAVAANLRVLEPVAEAFERARMELVESCARRGEDGAPEVAGGNFVISDVAGFERGFAELQGRVVDVALRRVAVGDMPELDLASVHALFPMIAEEAA